MTTVSNINASPAFHKYFDPVANLKKNLERALAADQLEIWFIGSRPPTREECELGYQWLRQDDLPGQSEGGPLPWSSSTVRVEQRFMPVLGVHQLKGTDWQAMGDHFTFVPASAVAGGSVSAALTMVNSNTHRTTQYVHTSSSTPWYPRWALLMPRDMSEPASRVWMQTPDQNWRRDCSDQEVSMVMFDFRGGVPLSVGPRESSASLRLGRIETEDVIARLSSGYYHNSSHLSTVHAYSLAVYTGPLIGDQI